jgi:hypothetical protein
VTQAGQARAVAAFDAGDANGAIVAVAAALRAMNVRLGVLEAI